ncbi:MAG TPA: hypothetical protein VK992_06210 [Candidatus Caenarcaniphilales bacterium]|nr:hypothetical protein [Candidatus Caenarcaniphilales bacterium]
MPSVDRVQSRLRRLVWLHAEPEQAVERLSRLGFEVASVGAAERFRIAFPELSVTVQRGSPRRDGALVAGEESDARDDDAGGVSRAHPNGVADVVGIGIASVDGERMIRELAPMRLEPAGGDEALGARAWIEDTSAPRLIVLEPTTEGRLAAALARHGEGPVALYLGIVGAVGARLEAALERPTAWPVGGTARLIRPERPWGPFLLVVDNRHTDERYHCSSRTTSSRGRRPPARSGRVRSLGSAG